MRKRRKIIKKSDEISYADMMKLRAEIEDSQENKIHRRYSDNEIARALKASAGFRTQAAKILGISPSAITQRLAKSKILKRIMDEVLEKTLDKAERKLDEALTKGEPWSVMFVLRSKGKIRGWGEKSTLELEIPRGGVLMIPPQANARTWEVDAIEFHQKQIALQDGDEVIQETDFEDDEEEYEKPIFEEEEIT